MAHLGPWHRPCPSCLQVSAGSLYPMIARLTVQSPPSRGTGFLSIEPLDPRSPRVGDTFILNLQAVGIPAPTFSHYYYMVCGTWGIGVLGLDSGQGVYQAGSHSLPPHGSDHLQRPDHGYGSGAPEDCDLRLCVGGPSAGSLVLLCGLLLSPRTPGGQLSAHQHPIQGL